MQENLELIHKTIATSYAAEIDAKLQKREGDPKSNWVPELGDTVFLRKPPTGAGDVPGISRKIQPLTDTRLFLVEKAIGPSTYILADPDTGSTELGFPQPVGLERLVPYDLCELETPINEKEPLYIEIHDTRYGVKQYRIAAQSTTGRVRLRDDRTDQEHTADLATLDWRWA